MKIKDLVSNTPNSYESIFIAPNLISNSGEEDIEESTRKKRIRDRIKNIFGSPRKKLQKNDSNPSKAELKEELEAGEKLKSTHTPEEELAL